MSVIMQNQFKSQGNQLIPSHQAELVLVYQRMIEAPNAQQKMSEQCRTPVCSAEALFFFFFLQQCSFLYIKRVCPVLVTVNLEDCYFLYL